MGEKIELNISEMAEGAFEERFKDELRKVLENIADPNTDPTKTRKVTLEAKLKADKNRQTIDFEVICKSTLTPYEPVSTKILIEKVGNQVAAAELKSKIKGQTYFDEEGQFREDTGKIININK